MRSRSIVHKGLGLVFLALSAGATLLSGGCGKARTELPAVVPLYGAGLPNVIANQYFVVMPDGTTEELLTRTEQQVRDLGGQVLERYDSVFIGFLANLSDQALEHIRRNPNISYIETDRILRATGVQTCTTPWGLDRIDQGPLPLDKVYAYDRTGKDVIVHVLDTGIDGTSTQISGRVLPGFNATGKGSVTDTMDGQGHGTHLAGIIGGTTVGVAKEAKFIPVKVLEDTTSCMEPPSGPISAVIAGIDWSLDQQDITKPDRRVLLLSCEAGVDIEGDGVALITALSAALDEQFVVVVSAGNRNADVNHKSFVCADLTDPKLKDVKSENYLKRIVVGATTRTDQRWDDGAFGSNYGPCVDVFAPGDEIPSIKSEKGCDGRDVQSGTSQAAAHVAGIAALMLEGTVITKDDPPGKIPGQIKENIVNSAWGGALGDIGDKSKNLLAHSPLNTGMTLLEGAGVDADGYNDGLDACTGATCGFCNENGQVCGKGLGCGGGLQCEAGTCERCGATEEPCCGDKCAANLKCVAGACECGALAEPCCGGTQCDSDTLACNAMSVCENCGGDKQLCCAGGSCLTDDLDCNPDTGKCETCGQLGLLCCDGSCLSASLLCDKADNRCKSCGGKDEPCCGGQCSGNLVCTQGTCRECGVENGPCCGNTCNGALDCIGGTCLNSCGSANQACCQGAQACDAGMDCVSGTCKGACTVRCETGGASMFSETPRSSAGDCATWGSNACKHVNSAASRIRFNGVPVGGTGDCGGLNEAICEDTPVCFQGTQTSSTQGLPKTYGVFPDVAIHTENNFCQ